MQDKNKPRILLVEDEGIIARDISHSLDKFGYHVVGVATSGEEAMQLVEQDKPDLVLMDVMLQGKMDGVEAAENIHSSSNVPVIYLTAYADEKVLERAKKTEPFGYLIKPFEDTELHFTIQMALYKHKMEQERELLINELKEALAQIKTLSGLLPICAWCKKIRDDKGYWKQVETYIQEHSDAEFTHAICPECRKKIEKDQAWQTEE